MASAPLLHALVLLAAAAPVPSESAPATGPAAIERPAIAGRRIIKHFDFNERPLGNYTSLPMLWRRHGGLGFPMYLEGRFDLTVGHASQPSFRLDLNGGSVGYHYEGRDIAVRTNTDYLVVAWVKTSGLKTARAYMTACYLDRKGFIIEGTERRSDIVGGTASEEWAPITIPLQGNVANSRYIGLAMWLTQATVWDTSARPPRHIEREDLRGSVWFDDITVYRLPRVTLQSASRGNVFIERSPELRTEVSDPDGLQLEADLSVTNADGQLVERRSVPVQPLDARGFTPFTYELPAGLYRAELVVRSGNTVLVRRALRFARLEPTQRAAQAPSHGLGVVLDTAAGMLLPGQAELLRQLRPEYVKLPIWKAQQAASGMVETSDTVDQYIEEIVAAGGQPIAMMTNDQRIDENDPARKIRSMVEILSDDPKGWRPLIAGTWARYAGLTHIWQVGADGDPATALDPRLPALFPVLQREMAPIVGHPILADISDAIRPAEASRAADFEAVTVSPAIQPDDFGGLLRPVLSSHPGHVWLLVEALPQEPYPRELRLTDLARRLVEAYYLQPAAVFIKAPWDTESDLLSGQVSPREDLIVARTVADMLNDAKPVSHMLLHGQARCVVFDRGGRSVLFAWDPYAPPQGREYNLLLSDDAVQVDLWGRRKPLPTTEYQHRVRLGPVPTFILNTPTWLMEFRRQFELDPPVFEASFDEHKQSICFRNTFSQPIGGTVHVVAPEDWDIRPNRLSFVLQPGEQFRETISIRFPLNAEAGLTPLVGDFMIDADRRYRVLIPAWFELGLRDIDVDTFVYRNGSRVIVRQSMTNRTAEPLNFDSYLIAPQRPRINRTFSNFQPRQTMAKEFVLDDAADLAGHKLRVSLKEIQGSRVWNHIVTVP